MKNIAMTDKKKKLLSGLLILIIAVIFNVNVNGNFAKAEDNFGNTDSECNKCYKSIMLEYGDTLWGIAAEYKTVHYESVQDYIDEVMSINHLKSDRICAGQYLMIPYYEDSVCYTGEYYADIQSKNNR